MSADDPDNFEPDLPIDPLRLALKRGDGDELASLLRECPQDNVALLFDRLSDDERMGIVLALESSEAADLLERIPYVQAVELVESLPSAEAADIMEALPSDAAADMLGDMDRPEAEAILREMEPADAEEARDLMAYADGTAGSLMRAERLFYPEHFTVSQVVEDLRQNADTYSDFDTQYAYVVDADERLTGVLRIRDLLFSPGRTPVTSIMIREPVTVRHDATEASLVELFDTRHFIALPVVDERDRLLGVVLRDSVEESVAETATEDFLKVSGLSGREELRSMPLHLRSGRRLSWLSINIVLNVMAASVIAFYQDTLAQVIALAVFLPIISDMSGCSGSQAVAVSIRELTLGLVRPRELRRVLLKEIAVGVVNGVVLGLLIALVAILWKGNPWLGVVVGTALMLNTMVAVCLGGAIPLMLKRRNLDPALASGPILTTVTDMCGFFFVLGFASLALKHLV